MQSPDEITMFYTVIVTTYIVILYNIEVFRGETANVLSTVDHNFPKRNSLLLT